MVYLFSSKPDTLIKFFLQEKRDFTLITKEIFADFQSNYSPFEKDLGIVYDFGSFIKESLLEKLYMVNVHFSLLPKYRGAIPVESAILNGDEKTGISIQKMVSKMDAGDVIMSKEIVIESTWNSRELQSYMDSQLPEMLKELFSVEKEMWTGKPQIGEPSFCYMKELNRENAQLNFGELEASEVVNRVRAFNPEPFAWMNAEINKKETTVNILSAEIIDDIQLEKNQVQFLKKRGVAFGTKEGTVLVTSLVVAGSKPLQNGDIVALKGSFSLHV